jgi:hypothetical protein
VTVYVEVIILQTSVVVVVEMEYQIMLVDVKELFMV